MADWSDVRKCTRTENPYTIGAHVVGEFEKKENKDKGYINIPKNGSCTLKGVWGGNTVLEPDPNIEYIVYLRKPINRFYSGCYTYGNRYFEKDWDKFFKCIIEDIENGKDTFYDEHMTPQTTFIEPFLYYPIECIILETAGIRGRMNQSCKKTKEIIIKNLSPYQDKIEQIYKKDVDLYNAYLK